MATRSTHVAATPDEVWSVLADPWSYATWVVGTVKIRDADSTWPAVGSKLHHSFGVWPLAQAAQACFGYGWDEFVTLPSRLSAEPGLRETRQAVLEAVARDGFVAGYSGIRIAKSGLRFRIRDTVIWQLIDEAGMFHGQAATFASWEDV